jgi:hypothetical protein
MFEGAVGSCNVIGTQEGVRVGGGAKLRALARVSLGDGPKVDTLSSGVVGYCGRNTFGDGLSVASGFVVPWWRVGRRISHSF